MNRSACAILAPACVLHPDEGEAELSEACGVDEALREEVRRMLVDSEHADSCFGEGVATRRERPMPTKTEDMA